MLVSRRGVMKGLKNTPHHMFQDTVLEGIPENMRYKLYDAFVKQKMRYPKSTMNINAGTLFILVGSSGQYVHAFNVSLIWEGCLINVTVQTLPHPLSSSNPARTEVLEVKKVTLAEWLFVD